MIVSVFEKKKMISKKSYFVTRVAKIGRMCSNLNLEKEQNC